MRFFVLLIFMVSLSGCQTPAIEPTVVVISQCPQGLKFAERDLSGTHSFDPQKNVYLQENGEICTMY